MLFPFLGYVVASTVITAVAVLLTGLVNTSTLEKARHHSPHVIARTVKVEVQRHPSVAKKAPPAKEASPVAKEASPAKEVSSVGKEASPAKKVPPVVSTAKADTKKASITNPKCSPVSATTTAMGTRWVMPKNTGTAQEVLFSNDPAHVI